MVYSPSKNFQRTWMNPVALCMLIMMNCSCSEKATQEISNDEKTNEAFIHEGSFDSLLKQRAAEGSIFVYSPELETFYSNDFDWAREGRIPASTYKIPHSIIALETGVVKSDKTMFYWDGADRALDVWEQDLTFTEAFRKSCVPCYQQVARKVGVERMQQMLQQLDYGHMKFDSTTIDQFWLTGASKISQFEQVDFLQRLMRAQLPIEKSTRSTVLTMMEMDTLDGAVLRGKTGWAIREDQNNGWFVGLLESDQDTMYVAVNINPLPEMDMNDFPRIRYDLAVDALKIMNKKLK